MNSLKILLLLFQQNKCINYWKKKSKILENKLFFSINEISFELLAFLEHNKEFKISTYKIFYYI